MGILNQAFTKIVELAKNLLKANSHQHNHQNNHQHSQSQQQSKVNSRSNNRQERMEFEKLEKERQSEIVKNMPQMEKGKALEQGKDLEKIGNNFTHANEAQSQNLPNNKTNSNDQNERMRALSQEQNRER